ncbi:MAG: hypothetical protein N4A38_01675 [Candidatus Gracilibacteria bacterium]|nr:hypothetical protein [Candidatus Gracilibacteria bacterium]
MNENINNIKQNIEEILNEIYDIDPTLKGREEELKKALEKMMEIKPQIKMSEKFKNDLRQRLYVEAKYGVRNKFSLKNFVQILTGFLTGGAVVGLSAVVIINSGSLNNTKDNINYGLRSGGGAMTMMSDAPENDFMPNNSADFGVKSVPKSAIPENFSEEKNNIVFEDAEIESFAVESMNEVVDEAKNMEKDSIILKGEAPESDEAIPEIMGLQEFDRENLMQKDISGKPPTLYKYSFFGEFPDLKKQYKYYKITTLNMGTTTVEDFVIEKLKDEESLKLSLDMDRMISSVVPADSDRYKEIVYDKVVFTYERVYKMKSEYLVPALWFSTSKHPIKGETFKPDQIILLVNENELK